MFNGYTPATQCEHRTCARFMLPHPGQVFRLFTSFKPLPAICLWRLFIWETFFLGTARSTESQISAINPGIVNDNAAGLKSVWGTKAEEVWMNRDHRPTLAGEETAKGETTTRGSICDIVDESICEAMAASTTDQTVPTVPLLTVCRNSHKMKLFAPNLAGLRAKPKGD